MKHKFIFIVLLLCAGCDDKLTWIKKPEPVIPAVNSINPEHGTVGTEVTVTGSNFSETLSQNKVSINGVEATINEVTKTELTFIAPNTTTGAVLVTVNEEHAVNRPIFTYE